MSNTRALVALCAIGTVAAQANAAFFFTFDDPEAGNEVVYLQPENDTENGSMTYGMATMPTINFVVDAQDEGGGLHEFEANLFWTDWEVGEASTDAGITTASVSGAFDFIDLDSGDSIVSGSFDLGFVLQANGAGSVITTSDGALTYVAGPALTAVEPNISFAIPTDANWTLTNIQFLDPQLGIEPDPDPTVQVGDKTFFRSFSASAAFTGTSEGEIPAPGVLALTGLAGLTGLRRRRA